MGGSLLSLFRQGIVLYLDMLAERFITLDLNNRTAFVWAEGRWVTSINDCGQMVVLYALPNFLAEVFFNANENQITRVDVLDRSHPRFQVYLDSLDLVELLGQ